MDELKKIIVSVVMPIYNEEKFISNCIESLLLQNYPKENMEWIFVDGNSTDRTVEFVEKYRCKYPQLISIMNNPNKTVPYAMNIGINVAKGKYIIRLDAHADYNKDYISKCVFWLDRTNADNVGGIAETKSKGFIGESIAIMLSSKFGVGNSQFRTNGVSGYVDTVPFGAFRKEVFDKLGGYDERLTRNQDNEMNFRIRNNGGKIYLSDEIRFSYYCRDSIKSISDMAIKNGMWNVITMKLCPGSMGVRHFVPFVFLLSVIILPILSLLNMFFLKVFIAELVLYFTLDIIFSFQATKSFEYLPMVFILFPIFHLTYGFGSLKGLFKIMWKQFI
ncbi:MAG: glycosyltransferase family 2 protein [Clostridium sp.]|nr:glycosyltransferase family 2 protein [Clostridium sp.]